MRWKYKKKKKPRPTKRELYKPPNVNVERTLLFWWASTQEDDYPALEMLYHIPIERKRGIIETHNLELMGKKDGIPDVCLPVPSVDGKYHGLYITMRSNIKTCEKRWIEKLNEQGYKAVNVNRFLDAKVIIVEYLGMVNNVGQDD